LRVALAEVVDELKRNLEATRADMPSSKKRSRKTGTTRQLARPYSSLIYAGKHLGEAREQRLKAESRSVIAHVLKNTPIKRIRLLGNTFPKNLNDLAGPIPLAPTDDLVTQLNWLHAVLCHHSAVMNEYQAGLYEFQNRLLVGDYDAAEATRTAIVERNGHSWWSIEAELLVAQKRRGLEGNREVLQRYHDKETNDWIKCICHNISLRVEDGFPAEDYDRHCELLKPPDVDSEQARRHFAYIGFRINFPNFKDSGLLPYCLSVEESHSLIDRYCSFVRAMQFSLALGDGELGRRIADIATATARAIKDPRLAVVAGMLQPEGLERAPGGDTVFAALDLYTAGRYEAAAEAALEGLAGQPGGFEFYELSVHSQLRGGRPPRIPFPESSAAAEILRLLNDVLSRNEDSSNSLRRLTKLSYQFDCLPIGAQILSFVRRHDSKPAETVNTYANHSTTVPTPRLSIFMEDESSALRNLTRLDQLHPGNLSVRLFSDVRRSLAARRDLIAADGIPETRLWKYRSFVFEQSTLYEEALHAYQKLDEHSNGDLLLKADATAGLYRCHLRLDRVLESASILARAAAITPWLVPESTIREVLGKYPLRRDPAWLRDVCWPVLHVTANMEGYARYDLDQLHDVLDEFLAAHELNRPTELRSLRSTLPPPCLVVVLWALCTTEVLQSSVWYDSQDEVERERIAICEWLVELDPPHAAEYLREIAELNSRATMRELAHKVGQSKIFVDTEGLKESLPQSFIDRAERCLQFAELRSELRGTLEAAKFKAENVKAVSIVIIDGALGLFSQLFNEVKQLFLYSNEYGLDSNLSQRIRHGTLLGAIRAPFEQASLVTLKNAEGVYLDNVHWLSRLTEPGETPTETARVALQELSRDIDSIAHEVRTRWIQIKGQANDHHGMFDYEFGEAQLHSLYEGMGTLATVDALVDVILEALWKRTEEDLQAARSVITGRLKERLSASLDRCQHSLEAVVSTEKVVEFRSAVTSCKTSLEYALESVAGWFRVDQANRMPAFTVAGLIDAILDNVERYCRPSHLEVTRAIGVTRPVQGRLFRPLWDVFFILCDNVAKHSMLTSVPVDLNVVEEDAKIRIEVVNELGQEVDLDELGRKAALTSGRERSDDEWDLLRREGGSGLTKIHKILRYEIRSEAYDLNVAVLEGRKFSVKLTFFAKGIFDESPSGR
jgi:hypothetical protein